MTGWKRVGWIAAGLLLLWVSPARAGDVSFTLQPMTNELALTPGEQYTGILTVANEVPPGTKPGEVEPLKLRLYLMDWVLDRKGSPSFFKPGTKPGNCASWVQVNPPELVVPAGEKREARYTINVPKDAPGGTYRTVIMFESAPQPRKEGDRVIAVNGRIGATLYAQVGPQSRRARIAAFNVAPDKATFTIENTGSSHVRLKGTLQFKDESGKMVEQVPLPGGVVLPGDCNLRDFGLDVPKTLSSGKYSVTLVVDYGGEVLIGARAQLTMP